MPRLGKRKRVNHLWEGARLFDLALDARRWIIPDMLGISPENEESVKWLCEQRDKILAALPTCEVIVADNVCQYVFAESPQEEWDATRDFPCCAPPFKRFFVECKRPTHLNSEGRILPSDHMPHKFGWMCLALEVPPGKCVDPLTGENVGEYKWIMVGSLIVEAFGKISGTTAQFTVCIDAEGVPLSLPHIRCVLGNHLENQKDDFTTTYNALTFPLLLTLSFMNCKNVRIRPEQSSQELDADRKRNGMRPFARFKTLDIEPMKEILSTEGQSGKTGLRRAIHICRGHFVRLTRNNKGELLEEPTLYYRNMHVRGSAKEGIVFKDYNIKPPKTEP